jgi:CDP-diacylglycerol--glycerol-3-phosphate 3-phosphatidyltransferase
VLEANVRALWDRLVEPVGKAIARHGIAPNAITLVGAAVQLVVAYEIVSAHLVAAGLIAVVAAVADAIDGAVAKAAASTTRFGALLDSTLDRLSDALFFGPVAWLYAVSPGPERAGQRWVAAIALAALVASFLVSYVKARAEGLGFECNVGIVARAERTLLMILALVFGLLPVIIPVLAMLSIVTILQRVLHVRGQARSAASAVR